MVYAVCLCFPLTLDERPIVMEELPEKIKNQIEIIGNAKGKLVVTAFKFRGKSMPYFSG